MAHALRIPEPLPTPCRVCGCTQVRVDAVEGLDHRAALLLAECPRCDHRWTAALTPRVVSTTRPMLRTAREGANAA